MKKKTIITLALICALVLAPVSGQLAMTVNAAGNDVVSDSEETDNGEETDDTAVDEEKEVASENEQKAFSQIHTQVFEELGIQVSIL